MFYDTFGVPTGGSQICHVRVYDEGLNELYMIELKESERVSPLIGVRNSNSNEVLFRDYYSTRLNLLVWNVEDLSDIEAFRLEEFSSTRIANGLISHMWPFAETLVLLND